MGARFGGGRFAGAGVAGAVDHHIGAHRRQFQNDRLADVLAAAADEGGFP